MGDVPACPLNHHDFKIFLNDTVIIYPCIYTVHHFLNALAIRNGEPLITKCAFHRFNPGQSVSDHVHLELELSLPLIFTSLE